MKQQWTRNSKGGVVTEAGKDGKSLPPVGLWGRKRLNKKKKDQNQVYCLKTWTCVAPV